MDQSDDIRERPNHPGDEETSGTDPDTPTRAPVTPPAPGEGEIEEAVEEA
jgi:hypothetical protein